MFLFFVDASRNKIVQKRSKVGKRIAEIKESAAFAL